MWVTKQKSCVTSKFVDPEFLKNRVRLWNECFIRNGLCSIWKYKIFFAEKEKNAKKKHRLAESAAVNCVITLEWGCKYSSGPKAFISFITCRVKEHSELARRLGTFFPHKIWNFSEEFLCENFSQSFHENLYEIGHEIEPQNACGSKCKCHVSSLGWSKKSGFWSMDLTGLSSILELMSKPAPSEELTTRTR